MSISYGIGAVLVGALTVLILDAAPWAGDGGTLDDGAAADSPVAGSGAPSPAGRATGEVSSATPARRAGALPAEDPTSVRLPSGREVRVVAVSGRTDGILDVPQDIDVAGWWRGGSRIGDPFGSTLVAAHVDSVSQGLGPFAELLSVAPGARVVVSTRGLHQAFRVLSLRLVPRDAVDEANWISSPGGPRRVTLVTCAGPYLRGEGGYQNLAVVTARPVGLPVRLRAAR